MPTLGRPSLTSIPHFHQWSTARPCGWYGWYGCWYCCWFCWFWLGSKFWLVPKSPAIETRFHQCLSAMAAMVLSLHLAYRIPWHNYLTCRSVLQYPWSCCPCKPRCWHKHPEHTGTPRWSHVESAIFKCIWSSTCIIMPKMAGCQLYHIFSNSLALLLIHWIQKQVKTIKLTHCLISSVMRSKISIASLSLRRKTACLCFIHLLLKTIPKKTPECSHTWYNTQYSRIHDKQKCTSMHYDAFIWWRHRS